MARETHIVFDLSDIRAVRIQCAKCKGEVMMALDGVVPLMARCPYCQALWYDSAKATAVRDLVPMLANVVTETDPLITLRFELVVGD